jgi:hypothetical protein
MAMENRGSTSPNFMARREFTTRSHFHESTIDVQLKVAGHLGFRILPGADEGILEFQCNAIKLLHDGEVGSQQFAREKNLSIEI